MDTTMMLLEKRLRFIANPAESNHKPHRHMPTRGIMWIALNKKGTGIHGTNTPDSIGRAASHGCIRLANWDVVRLALKIKSGDSVSIH